MKKPVVLLLNGPNLDMLGRRDPAQYGTFTLADVERAFAAKCEELGVEPRFFQSGCEGELILDRIEAIKAAVRTAEKGDLVLILGKGDETYMYYADGRVPFIGDNAAAREALKEVLG